METHSRLQGEDYSDSDSFSSSTSSAIYGESRRPFHVLRGFPVRRAGPACSGKAPSSFSSEESDSEMSLSDAPLSTSVHRHGGKRHHGRGGDAFCTQTVSFHSEEEEDILSDTSSSFLPVRYVSKRCKRIPGPCSGKKEYIISVSSELLSISDEEEEEQQLNAVTILNLVKRIRNCSSFTDLPLEAFQIVNWEDDNFQEEIAPLKKLFAFMESMTSAKKSIVDNRLTSQIQQVFQKKVKEALESLPEEKAIVAKVKAIKNRNIVASSAGVPNSLPSFGTGTATLSKKKCNNSGILCNTSQASVRESSFSASFSDVLHKREHVIKSSEASIQTKESAFSESERRVRRQRTSSTHSTSFMEASLPEEVVEIKEDDVSEQLITKIPDNARKRRSRKTRGGQNISFSDLPMENVGEIDETAGEVTTRPPHQRRLSTKGRNRSCNISDIGELPSGEICEPEGADDDRAEPKSGRRTKMVLRRRKRVKSLEYSNPEMEDGNSICEDEEKFLPTDKKKTRHTPTNRRRRDLSISKVDSPISGEIYENNTDADGILNTNASSHPFPRDILSSKNKININPPHPISTSKGRTRRVRTHVSQELSISAIPDETAEEIEENDTGFLHNTR